MLRRVFAFSVALLLAGPARGNVAYRERNNTVFVAELLIGGSNLMLGVENYTKGKSTERNLRWAALGIGVAGLGIGLSTLDEASMPKFDVIASAIAIGGSAFRIRGPLPGQNRVWVGPGAVRVRYRF